MLAFATELCLKAWAIRYGPDDMKFATHKLDKLFALLPDEIRQKLKHGYEVKYGRRDCPIFGNWEMDLESALEADRDAFVHWRYLYEHDGAKFSTTRSMDIIEFLLDEFFKTIHVRKLSANPLG